MNERTLKILEYSKIIDKVIEFASSTRGKELASELKPSTCFNEIEEGLQITSEAVKVLCEANRAPLGGIFDIRFALKRVAAGGVLNPEHLMEIGSTLRAARMMKDFLAGKGETLVILAEWGGRLASFPGLERELERCLGPGGEVLDHASPKLHSLRTQIKVQQNRVREKLDHIVHSGENAKYLQEQIVTVRNERYVIPVKQEYRSLFPGIVHDQSASGATLFIEPMSIVELNNQLRVFESQELEEIERILAQLSSQVREIAIPLGISTDILARLDLAFAKGQYSLAIRGVQPELNQDGILVLYRARHPLLTGKVVPTDIYLGNKFDTLVITGPNTGGKTVTLKTVGLLTVMALSGLHIPAEEGSKIAIFERIFCDIGDEQSIEQSLSTFSSHLTQIVKIIAEASSFNTLVLLDELGAGTDPAEGAALAISILTHLHQLGVRTVATTHYSELKAFAYQTEGIENASVEFDIQTLRPTYHLQIGLPGGSQAFEIALKLGLPRAVVDHARTFISTEAAQVDAMLRDIEGDRKKARDNQRLSEEARIKGETFKNQYEKELTKLKLERAELVRQSKAEAREILIEARRESENLLRRLREGRYEDLPEIVNQARQHFSRELERLEEPKPVASSRTSGQVNLDELRPGTRVKVFSLEQSGTILEVGNENALVQIGIMKVNLPFHDLAVLTEEPVKVKRQPRQSGSAGFEVAQNISAELSLRGLTVDEALYQLEKYLDQAILAGLNRFRVIHGKGTGALRQAVQQYLRNHPVVQSAVYAEQNEGGLGATVVELKK